MITIIGSLIAAHLGLLTGLITGAAGIIFGLFRHQQAKAATSAANATVAQVQATQANSQAAAATHAEQDIQNAQASTTSVAQVADADLDAQLKAEGGLTK